MIQIELSHALALYSAVLLVLVSAIWLYTEISVKRPQRYLGRQFLWRCTFCACTYLDESAHKVSKCPRCESYNTTDDGASLGAPTAEEEPVAQRAASDASVPSPNTSRKKRHHQRRRGPRRRRG